MLRANGDGAWFGWPKDDQLEALRTQWLNAADVAERQGIAAKMQEHAFAVVPYIPTGQFVNQTAYRKNIKGIVQTPALFVMWNVEKV